LVGSEQRRKEPYVQLVWLDRVALQRLLGEGREAREIATIGLERVARERPLHAKMVEVRVNPARKIQDS
jgi:hypothetical protein